MEDVLDVYCQPYDASLPRICMDEMGKNLVKDKYPPEPCAGYFAHPFTKWVILLLISVFSRSWGIHRRMTVDPQQQLEQVCPQLLAFEALKRV